MKDTTETANAGAPDLRKHLLVTALASLKPQITLLDACLAANRIDWANETVVTIRSIADKALGVPLPSSAEGTGEAGTKTTARKRLPPPTPDQIAEVVRSMIGSQPLAGFDGPLVAVSFNGHHLKVDKAESMYVPILEIVKRAHIVMVQETNVDALRVIAKKAGYGLNVSHRNNREQANGILFHPRLQWLGDAPYYHDYLLEVPGHPEYKVTLRPALQRRVKDLVTGFVFDVLDWHGKSNVGGPDETRPIRRHQFEMLVEDLAKQLTTSPYKSRKVTTASVPATGTEPGTASGDSAPAAATPGTDAAGGATTDKVNPRTVLIDPKEETAPLGAVLLGGDFNCPIQLATTTEIEPLVAAGLKLVPTTNGGWSYRYKTDGGQFDGFFARGFPEGSISTCWIPAFPETKRDSYFYSIVSDHLPVFMTIQPPAKPAAAVPAVAEIATTSDGAQGDDSKK